jgi:cytochrome c oxidase assembly protein subunit 15
LNAPPAETRSYAAGAARATPRWLHRYAVVTMCATFVLIIAGGIVTTRGAGLAVPDWPLSYGQFMPERWYAIANIAAEHTHRMIAGTVALLMLGLAICTQLVERRRSVRILAWTALAAVIAQALLGGATVLILGEIRPVIRVFHAALAQTFFMLTISLAVATSRWWQFGPKSKVRSLKSEVGAEQAAPHFKLQTSHFDIRAVALLAAGALFVQLMLGAVMRHTESGLALIEFPTSYEGRWLPPTSAAELARHNAMRFADHWLEYVTLPQMWFNFAHRAGAVLVTGAIAGLAVFVFRRHADDPRFVSPTIALIGLLFAQVALGVVTVFSLRNVWITTLHVGTGVLMFAVSFNLVLRAFRLEPAGRSRGAGRPSAPPVSAGLDALASSRAAT